MKKIISRSDRPAGFTLIEFIGVLAIMAILAGVLSPSVVRQITTANGTKEDQNLQTIAAGLQQSIKNTQTIPGNPGWVTNVANVTGLNTNQVLRVDPQNAATARVYLIYPAFAPGGFGDPLYQQTSAGTAAPSQDRILLISSTKATLVLPVASGRPANTLANRTAFDNIWNWNYNPAAPNPPAGWPAAWNGNAEHLHVQRVNLGTLFYPVTVSNTQFLQDVPYGKFNGSATVGFNVTNSVSAYYLEGTVIQLYKHDSPFVGIPANPDEMDLAHSLARAMNFIYEGNLWRIP